MKFISLVFVDDLFLLTTADLSSVRIIKESLDAFSAKSGLKPNMMKCELFVSGVTSSKKLEISKILGMLIGLLPIRYLGVPFITRKRFYTNFSSLLERMHNRIASWKAKNCPMVENFNALIQY